jgi:DNA polymerase epsilon subunit 1
MYLLTSKPTAGSAAAYGRYLISALTSRDLFRHLNLDIVHHWEYLLWMDPANFGGVICRNPEEVFADEEAYRAKKFQVDMNWNIATFLPVELQDRFAMVIGGFIKRLYESKRNIASTRLLDRTPLMQITADETGEVVESHDTQAAKALVSKFVTRKMLLQVQEIQNMHIQDHDWQWPDLPGRNYDVKEASPALEFAKTAFAVLGLHKEASVEVGICRRNVLDIVGVGEFSALAEFKNPCESLLVPGVICSYCNEDRVLDLCRDVDLLQDGEWKCNKCSCPFDKMEIEMKLCSMAMDLIQIFCLQDLRCNKCNRLKEGNVALHCPCSGTWGLTVTKKDTRSRLENMQRVAKFHKLMVLQEAVEELLERC